MNESQNEVSSDDDSSFGSAQEVDDCDDGQQLPVICLFCEQTFTSIAIALSHMIAVHCFDLVNTCKKFDFDAIQYIKLLNYVRDTKPESGHMNGLIEGRVWDTDAYMRPHDVNDQFLTFDIESEYTSIAGDERENMNQLSRQQLINIIDEYKTQMIALNSKICSMSEVMNNCLTSGTGNELNTMNLSESEDSYYISSYSHFSIHHEMLSDRIRTNAYKDVILRNADFFKDKIVLDVGCGTGILSLFAAKAGAKLVVAVDQSDIIHEAIDIIRQNGFNNKIVCVQSKLESIDFSAYNLPNKYDIILSEWMGYFLLFEGMLDSILYARNVLLQKDGLLLPNRCLISIAGSSDQSLRKKYVDFWDDVYDFKMSCMKTLVFKEPTLETVSKEFVCTSVCTIKQIDLLDCLIEDTQHFNCNFHLTCTSDDYIYAIVGWFDSLFDCQQLSHGVTLSTSPFNETTHWKQTVFLLKNPIYKQKGETIDGNIAIARNKKDVRSLRITIEITNYEKQVYYLS